jgi:cytoskeletal protein CcmA (bactofilin family)
MFRKSEPQKAANGRRVATPRASSGEGAISIIGPGMHIRGDLSTEGSVRVEGSVEGTIRAGKAVVLGKEGRIVGDIVTQDAVIGGYLQGSIMAESRLELQATCVVEGEIRTRSEHLKLDEGARFNGAIQMASEAAEEPAPAPVPDGETS